MIGTSASCVGTMQTIYFPRTDQSPLDSSELSRQPSSGARMVRFIFRAWRSPRTMSDVCPALRPSPVHSTKAERIRNIANALINKRGHRGESCHINLSNASSKRGQNRCQLEARLPACRPLGAAAAGTGICNFSD